MALPPGTKVSSTDTIDRLDLLIMPLLTLGFFCLRKSISLW